jgi:hypothetical protein
MNGTRFCCATDYHNVFRPDLSSTYREDKQDRDIYLSYAEIEVQGPLAQDTLTVSMQHWHAPISENTCFNCFLRVYIAIKMLANESTNFRRILLS